jgi:hypothetical protein
MILLPQPPALRQHLKGGALFLYRKMAAHIRNKTFRKSSGLIVGSGGGGGDDDGTASSYDLSENAMDFAMNQSIQRLIQTEAATALKRPWHRLERGLRLNRLRAFVDDLGTKRGLKDGEKAGLLGLLTKALDKKMLNSKTAIEYDPDTEMIKEIKPLVMHQSATGEVLFQLLEKRNAVTFRKRGGSAGAAGAGASQPQPDAQPQA